MTDSRESSVETAVGVHAGPAETTYAFGPFQFSVTRLLLTLNGEPVRLGSRATSILHALVERPGELVSKEDLVARAWPSTHVEEGNLRVHIASVRRALGDGGDVSTYIANVAGRGYRFLVPVRRVVTQVDLTYDDVSRVRSGSLPGSAGPLVGRDADFEALTSILRQTRHTTLVGPGGIGKTSVAISVGNAAREDFQNAVYFIDLAAVSDPSFVPFAFASSVHVAIDTERPVDSLATRLRNDRALLIVDNCEHLIEPAALVVESLLNNAPGIHILATSHEPLRTQGERVYRLTPFMPHSGAEALPLREAIELPAIELFVRHMLATDESAFIGDADVPYMVEICRRLDGLPLAIEIAASRAGALGIAELASRLDDRFGILTSGRRTAAVRHQALRNMLDWSHTLLSGRDRSILRRLSVFAGEFSLDAAGLVARDESLNAAHVMEGLSNLVRKSLLVQTSTAGNSTYRLLDSARLYAFEKLEDAGEVGRVRLLHVSYLCDVLRQAEIDWRNTPSSSWTEEYQKYIDDIRTALKWSLEDDNDREGGVVLTSLALPLAMQLGLHDEFRERMFMAMERTRGFARAMLVSELRLHVAKNPFTFNVGQPLDVSLERAVEIGELLDDDRHRLEPLVQISSCHAVLGQYEAAAEVGARALELAEKCADQFAIAARQTG